MLARAFLLSLLVVAACGRQAEKASAPPAPSNEAQDLNIEIGRYGVMIDHVRNLADGLPGAAPTPTGDDTRRYARMLRETAWEYNLERSRLCARGLYTQQSCGPVFEPVWLSDPADAQPTLAEIRQRADALGAEVQPFWSAICDDARNRTPNDQEKMYVCAIE